MTERMKAIMESSYQLPKQTRSEEKLAGYSPETFQRLLEYNTAHLLHRGELERSFQRLETKLNEENIRELCDRCIVLDQGKLIFDGDVEEAIHIYLNKSIEEHAVDMDLTEKSVRKIPSALKMKHLTLTDKITPVFDNQESLKMQLRLEVEQPVRNVQMRLTVRTETDVAVGTSWAAGRDFLQTGEVTADYEFPLNLLVKGHYYVSVGFYCMNDIGRMVIQDHVTRAFRMEILPKVEIKGWSSRAYGNVQFPDMK